MANVFEHELHVASALARRAGAAVLGYYRRPDLSVDAKPDASPITQADREAEALILEGLGRAFPKDGILSEEASEQRSWHAHPRAWVVDPLDGTADFVAGRDGFSVMIGLLVSHRPVLGVVYQPTHDRLYRGAVGAGAEKLVGSASPICLSPRRRDPGAPLVLVVSRSHRSPRVDALKQALGVVTEIQEGSVGVKVGLIAEGRCDLYLNPEGHCKLWDTCAPEAILTAAGGRISDLRGNQLVYDDAERLDLDRGIIAASEDLHPLVVQRIAPLLR